MMEESDAESPRTFVKKKLSELALAARNTRAQVFRASPDDAAAAAADEGPSSAHRARALRSHYQRHYQEVHGILKAAEPVRKPEANGPSADTTSDSGVTVLNSLQQFNFFSYFMPTLTTTDAQQESIERSEMVPSPPPPSLASSSSSSSLFGFTSPTYIVPSSSYTPPPNTALTQHQSIPQQVPPQRQPTPPPPVPAEDDLSWVPKFSTAQRISPLERREKFAAAQSMVNSAVVDGLGSDIGKLGSLMPTKSSSSGKTSKSVTINLTPMKSFQEGGGLYGAPLTIAPGTNLDIDTLLGTTQRDKKNDDDGDDEEDDTKVDVDFALHVELSPGGARRRSSSSSSTSSNSAAYFFNDDGSSKSRSSVDTTSPGPVSELIGIFERKEEGAAATGGSQVVDTASAEKRMAMLETVAEKLSLVMERLIQDREREREKAPSHPLPPPAPAPSLPLPVQASSHAAAATTSATVSEELYSDLSKTLAELRQTLTSQLQTPPSPSLQAPYPTHADVAVIDDIPAPSADTLSPTLSHSSSSDEGASTVDPENTAVKSLDALQSELEALRIERDQEKDKAVQRAETLQSERDALRQERDNATQQLELLLRSKEEAASSLRRKVIALEAETEALRALQLPPEPPQQMASSSSTQTERVLLTSTHVQTVPKTKTMTADASTAPLTPPPTLAAEMQTDTPASASAPMKRSVTVQTASIEVEAEHAEVVRDLQDKLAASEQGRVEADLRLEEAVSSLRRKVFALEAETEALRALQLPPAPPLTVAAEMQTDAPAPAPTTMSVTVQTAVTTSPEVVEAEHAEVVRDLKSKLVASEQGRFEADLRLEEALLEAEKQRLQSVMELSKMRRSLASEKEGMEQLARDLEGTFETLALTLVELSMEREEDLL